MRHVQGCLVARRVITPEGTVRDCRVLEILIGVDVSNNVTVNVPNSIDYRLTRLIAYLDGKHRRN